MAIIKRITKFKRQLLSSIMAVTLCSQSYVDAAWTTPVPISPPGNELPAVAISPQSTVSAAWVSISRIFNFSAQLVKHNPVWFPPTNIAAALANEAFSRPLLVTDLLGNRLSAWYVTDTLTNIPVAVEAARLPEDSYTWSAAIRRELVPTNADTLVSLAADRHRNLLAAWTVPNTPPFFTDTVVSALRHNNQWTNPLVLGHEHHTSPTHIAPAISVSHHHAIIVWKTRDTNATIRWARYNFATDSWGPVSLLNVSTLFDDITDIKVARDIHGNVVGLFLGSLGDSKTLLYASTLQHANNAWSTFVPLSNPSNYAGSPRVVVDIHGKAFAAWTEQTNLIGGTPFVVVSERRPNHPWRPNTVLSGSHLAITDLDIAVDIDGNAVIIWGTFDGPTNSTVQFSSKPFDGTWDLSAATLSGTGTTPRIAINHEELIAAVWQDTMTTEIMASTNNTIFPAKPRDFEGKVYENTFINDKQYVLELRWKRSISPNIIEYRIYRNDILVKRIPVTEKRKFVKQLSNDTVSGEYSISAVNSFGHESHKVPLHLHDGVHQHKDCHDKRHGKNRHRDRHDRHRDHHPGHHHKHNQNHIQNTTNGFNND